MSPDLESKVNTIRVMVVQEDRDDAEQFREILEQMEIQVEVFQNGIEALVALKENSTGVVIADESMDIMNGLELCKHIKTDAELADVPIILVTREYSSENLKNAFDAGAVDYIAKPIEELEISARLRSVLKLKTETELRKQREKELIRISQELIKSNQKLKEVSLMDGLTDIPNRRFFNQTFILEWKRATRNNGALSIIMIDIDFFKRLNDRYGHQVGDVCLIKVAQTLKRALKRPSDFIGRYGGEEFGVILPDTPHEGAKLLAERMLTAVEELQIPNENSEVKPYVTISAGVACIQPKKDHHHILAMQTADRLLYQAKEQGRNQVVVLEGYLDKELIRE